MLISFNLYKRPIEFKKLETTAPRSAIGDWSGITVIVMLLWDIMYICVQFCREYTFDKNVEIAKP